MQHRRYTDRFGILVIILMAGILVLLTWANFQYSYQSLPGSEFLVQWVGTRNLITKEISPYGDETLQQIQHLAFPTEIPRGIVLYKYVSPLYAIAIFWPFALIPKYFLAQSIWMTLLETGLVFLSLLSMQLMHWKPDRLRLVLFLLFSILWYPAFRSLISGNVIILTALALVGGVLALRNNGDELAGVLLAFMTISPQAVAIPLLFVLYWCVSRKRWRVIGWFFLTLLLLGIAVTLFIPDWLLENLRAWVRPVDYYPPGTPAQTLAVWFPLSGERIGWAISAVLGLILLLEWRVSQRTGFRGFLWTLSLTLAISPLTGLPVEPGSYVLLIPALVLVLSEWEGRWLKRGRIATILLMLIIFIGLWSIFLQNNQAGLINQQYASLLFPMPVFLIIMLYWFRWWVTQEQTSLSELP